MTEQQPEPERPQPDIMPLAFDASRELLARNPIEDIEAETDRVLGDLLADPNTHEVDDLLDYPIFRGRIIEKYYDNLRDKNKWGDLEYRNKGLAWLSKLMTYFGYEDDEARKMLYDYLRNYTETGDQDDFREQESQFFKRLEVLEKLKDEDPNAAVQLTRRWGITAFERHNPYTLLEQLEDERPRDTLIVMPRADHNGAMADDLERSLWGYADLGQAFYIEAGSATELGRIGVRLKRRGHGFDKVVVAVHSDGKDLTLSSRENWGEEFGIRQMSQERVRQWIADLGILNESAEVLLRACSVGMEGGLQDEVHKLKEVSKTIAPTKPAHTRILGGRIVQRTKDGEDVTRILDKNHPDNLGLAS